MREFFKNNKGKFTIGWTIISILSVAFGVYAYFFPFNQNPHVTIYIKNTTDVFQLNTDNKDIKVIFRDKDILKEKLNLKVTNIKIINNGKSDISPRDFDLEKEPFGIGIARGKLISTEIYDVSNSTFQTLIDSSKSDSTKIFFKSFIFPKNSYFHIRLTYLHSSAIEPRIIRYGEIVNTLIDFSHDAENISVFDSVLALILGSFILIFIVLVLIDIYKKIKGLVHKRRTRKIREIYRRDYKGSTIYQTAIEEFYTEYGHRAIKFLKSVIKNGDKGKMLFMDGRDSITINIMIKYNCYEEINSFKLLKDDFLQEANEIVKIFE